MTLKDDEKIKGCEILAPAGSKEAFIAAIEAGADAVYVGGTLFNARMNASNFDLNQMKEAVDFAHKRGVCLYVTVNTLIKEEELWEALSYCTKLYEIGVDALIIQDLGLASLLRKNLPDFPLHMSTQGTVYNLEGVNFAAKAGFERVVLSRELSFEEVEYIGKHSNTEIEVFVHGALCMCYSGQCQMSRFLGGRSGNRGECAQPCRLPYKAFDKKGKLIENLKYPLSPSDLCLIERLGDLIDAGVKSLKIEGRMKSPEYVAQVVSIYRKYVDLYYENGEYVVSEEDIEKLEQIFNRGGFTEGFFGNDRGKEYLSGNIPKHRGLLIGQVKNPNAGRDLVDIELKEEFATQNSPSAFVMGDGVEIQGKNGRAGNVVTYYKPIGKKIIRIGDIKGAKGIIAKGDPVYRITSKTQMKDLEGYYKGKDLKKGAFRRKQKVNMILAVTEDGRIQVDLKVDQKDIVNDLCHNRLHCGNISMTGEISFEADNEIRDLSGRFQDSFRKTGNTPFKPGEIIIDKSIQNCRFNISMSDINHIRREAFERLERDIEEGGRRPHIEIPGDAIEVAKPKTLRKAELQLFFFDVQDVKGYIMPERIRTLEEKDKINVVYLIPVFQIEDMAKMMENQDYNFLKGKIIPFAGNVIEGKGKTYIRENVNLIAKFCNAFGDGSICVGNIGLIEPFKNAGLKVKGDFGLNIFNWQTEKFFEDVGLEENIWSLENQDRNNSIFPLMISRHDFGANSLAGRKNMTFRIKEIKGTEQQVIMPVDRKGEKEDSLIQEFCEKVLEGETPKLRLYID